MRTAFLLAALSAVPALAQVTVELGPEQTVMVWSDGQRCGTEDIPDQPARAFVDASGRVHLLAGHFQLYASVGDNLEAVTRDCSGPVSSSHHDPEPRRYDDVEWLFGTYTLDGQTVYALVHDEYHGWEHVTCASGVPFDCWWNSVTLVVSRDGGATFPHAAPLLPPAHVIASSPYDFDAANTTGPVGFFEPSNVIGVDGRYYAFLRVQPTGAQAWGTCLARTDDLERPGSWRGWDGSAFTVVLDRGICPPLDRPNIGAMGSSLGYDTYLRKYVLVGSEGGPVDFHLAVSDALTAWPARQVLMATDLWWTPGATRMRGYPSLLQPGDATRSFERPGRSPWLYYTYWDQTAGTYARDLVRRRVRFNVPGDEGRHQVLELPMNELRGTATLDASFYGNDATLEGGAALATGERATGPAAVRLPTGAAARLRVPDAPSLALAGSLTIEAFVRIDAVAGEGGALVTKDGGGLRNYGLHVLGGGAVPGVLSFSFTAPGGVLSTSAGARRVDDGRWHHVAVSFEAPGGTARYYVDGVLDVERAHGAALGAGVNDGAVVAGAGLAGMIDGVVVHDHVRTALELQESAIVTGNVVLGGPGAGADAPRASGGGCSCGGQGGPAGLALLAALAAALARPRAAATGRAPAPRHPRGP